MTSLAKYGHDVVRPPLPDPGYHGLDVRGLTPPCRLAWCVEVGEVAQELSTQVEAAERAGVCGWDLVVDPGE